MVLPGVSNTILDGGLGVTSPASSIPHIIGVTEIGAFNTPTMIANPRVLKETFGTFGPAIDMAAFVLGLAGGPVIMTRATASVPASFGAADAATLAVLSSISPGVDNEINLAVATSAPKNDYSVIVRITVGGVRAATRFTYSLDGGLTTSPELVAAASVALGTSGVTLEFEAAATAPYVAGATYTFTANSPHYSAANLTTAFDAAKLSLLIWDYFLLAGEPHSSVAGALIFAGLETNLDSYVATRDQYYRGYMNAGREAAPATVLTSYAASVGERSGVIFGNMTVPSPFPQVGRGFMIVPAVNAVSLRAAGNVISTDLAKTAGADSVGPVPGVVSISHNEFNAEAGLDAVKIGTLRTYPNLPGFFITNAWLKAAPGSDFEFWQHGRIMDQACRIVSGQHTQLISSDVEVKSDGTGSLTEAGAQEIEKKIQRALDNAIGSSLRGIGPTRIGGKVGHVSDVLYQVDRTNNVLSTKTLIATVSIVPLGYLKRLTTTLSYKLAL